MRTERYKLGVLAMMEPYFLHAAGFARPLFKALTLTLALACATLLAGCGKKGILEPPPGYEEADKAARIAAERKKLKNPIRDKEQGSILRQTNGEVEPAVAETKITPLDPQPFILDPLVE